MSTAPNIEAADLRALLAAVLEAIDIPHPATVADESAYHYAILHRLCLAIVTGRAALTEGSSNLPFSVDYIRAQLEQYPTDTYNHSSAGGTR